GIASVRQVLRKNKSSECRSSPFYDVEPVFLLPNWLLPLVSRYWRSVVPTHETAPYFRRFFVAPEDIALHGLILFLLCIHSPCLAPKQLQSRA
ncbi:hypothetical protein, partial [Alcaligenes faecalis]|uniref:hypothetical protein n=3 Tax=Alcaligenes faecalis TaxID=511 RepID=UPI001969B025